MDGDRQLRGLGRLRRRARPHRGGRHHGKDSTGGGGHAGGVFSLPEIHNGVHPLSPAVEAKARAVAANPELYFSAPIASNVHISRAATAAAGRRQRHQHHHDHRDHHHRQQQQRRRRSLNGLPSPTSAEIGHFSHSTTSSLPEDDDDAALFPPSFSSSSSSATEAVVTGAYSHELSARLSHILRHHLSQRRAMTAPSSGAGPLLPPAAAAPEFFGTVMTPSAVAQLQHQVRARSPWRSFGEPSRLTQQPHPRHLLDSRGSSLVSGSVSGGGGGGGGGEGNVFRMLDSRGSIGSSFDSSNGTISSFTRRPGTVGSGASSRPETPHAAQRIQDAWRFRLWSLDRVSAALRLQTWYRGWRDRARAYRLMVRERQTKFLLAMMSEDNAVRRRAQMALALLVLRNHSAEVRGAVRVQSAYRGVRARRESNSYAALRARQRRALEISSSIVCQRWIRRYLATLFVDFLRMSISHMTQTPAVGEAIDALVFTGGHKHLHWRRTRALSVLETLTLHWSRDSGPGDGGNRVRRGLGLWVLAEMRRRGASDKSQLKAKNFFGSIPEPLAAFGRRDWPSGQPASFMCVKRGQYYVLSAHWQFLEGAVLAGAAVVAVEEAREMFPDPPMPARGRPAGPASPSSPSSKPAPPDSPRGPLIAILRRGSRNGRRRAEAAEAEKAAKKKAELAAHNNTDEDDGAAGGGKVPKKKAKKKKKRKKKKRSWFSKSKKTDGDDEWAERDKWDVDEHGNKVPALPLRCMPVPRIHLLFRKMLGDSYKKLYSRRKGFDGITLEEYCERYPAIFQVRHDVREIALRLRDDEEDTGSSRSKSKRKGALPPPQAPREAFDFYCEERLPKLKRKRAHKKKTEHQLKDVCRSKWRRMGDARGKKKRKYTKMEAADAKRFVQETKAYNDQAVVTGVQKIDPMGTRPARLPFQLHVRALRLGSAALMGDRRRAVVRRRLRRELAKSMGQPPPADSDEDDESRELRMRQERASKRQRRARGRDKRMLSEWERLEIEEEEADPRPRAQIEREIDYLRSQWAEEQAREEEEDRNRAEEAAAFWYCGRWDRRPTSTWCDVTISVRPGQESGGGKIQNVDLDSVSMDALEATIFSCIPIASRVLRLSVVRRETANAEGDAGVRDARAYDEKGRLKRPRYRCLARLSDIQSVLSLLRHVRLGTFKTRTVHGHTVELQLGGHPLLVPEDPANFAARAAARAQQAEGAAAAAATADEQIEPMLPDLDPFQKFKAGHLKQHRAHRGRKVKGGPMSWDLRVARRMLQAAVLVPVSQDPFGGDSPPGDDDHRRRRRETLTEATASANRNWLDQRTIWWDALARVDGGAHMRNRLYIKPAGQDPGVTPYLMTLPGGASARMPRTILCLPSLACRRYSAYRAGLLMRAVLRVKRRFMNQAAAMQELRRRHHLAQCRKHKIPLMTWLWRCRIRILERFDAVRLIQAMIRGWVKWVQYGRLRVASVVFQRHLRGLLGRRRAQMFRDMVLGNWPKVVVVYERVRIVHGAQGPLRIKVLKCGLNYLLEGFSYELCESYRGFLPQQRVQELCERYPYGVTGAYSLRKRIRLQPHFVDELVALFMAKLALVEPIKGLGEMEERSRAGNGTLVLVVDPLNGRTPEGLDGPGFDGIQGTYVEEQTRLWRREDISAAPWMTKPDPPLPIAPGEWEGGARDAAQIWEWWGETLKMWKMLVRPDSFPFQVRAAYRMLLRRQGNAGSCRTKILQCFRRFDVHRTGFLATSVLETALLWLGGVGQKEKKKLKDMIREALHVVEATDTERRLQEFSRANAAELSLGISSLPGLKFGFIAYEDFVDRADSERRSSHPKGSVMRGLAKEFAAQLRDRESYLYTTVKG